MEPPQAAALIIAVLSSAELFLVATYEATFSVLSRSALEKLQDERSRLMLRIYEPRHRLRLLARIGEVVGTVALTLSLLLLVNPILEAYDFPGYYAVIFSALGTVVVYLTICAPRRLRFDEDGEEMRIPALALAFVPLHTMLLPLTNLFDRITSGDYNDEEFRAEKEEELRSIVESESETGVIEEGEREMIQGVFGFHDRIAREVMVPRVDIAAVELTATLEDLLRVIEEDGHSRIPLYRESLDNIHGIIFARDLLQLLINGEHMDLGTPLSVLVKGPDGGSNGSFVHEPYYVPETKKIEALLRDFRAARNRLAIVVDEYGGTAGLLTIEDMVEEIVGEIQDEYDDEEELFHWEKPESILIANGRIDIDDLNNMLETELPNEGFETLGGFIYDHLGHIPSAGQSFRAENLEITVLKVEGQRISEVQIKRLSKASREKVE